MPAILLPAVRPVIDHALLSRAVARGILTAAQVEALDRLAREVAAPEPERVDDDERLRFITGFADIFVTLGIALFLGAAWWLAGDTLGETGSRVLVAALAWGLAEFFTRRRRMALPSIALLAIFAVESFLAVSSMAGIAVGWGSALPGPSGSGAPAPLPYAGAALATLALCALHYRRFSVPITIAAGAAALAGTLLALAFALVPSLDTGAFSALLVAAGLAVFALAMRFDLADRQRQTRRTDIAFWLHLLAAPLIVHPMLTTVLRSGDAPTTVSAILVLGVVLLLALVALVTDRRAILVAGLTYAGIAFGTLIRDAGFTSRAAPLSFLALGAFVLLLSAGWHAMRGLVLRGLPARLAARLPHPIGAR
ncbi:hypothetical protein [Methylobacterium sp. WL12]|uniref:hypothetical protein n=1 Tax=Methylobacterium sp. WL12 TaxID=2603890 RepID=UPI001FEF8B99|nr:hypothetical protein [Methylobacterium sp. WL12]